MAAAKTMVMMSAAVIVYESAVQGNEVIVDRICEETNDQLMKKKKEEEEKRKFFKFGHVGIAVKWAPMKLKVGLFDCTSDHGLGPWTRSGVCAFDSGPRTRTDILPQTRSEDKNRRLIFLPLMSDSVQSPRCLVGAFDVGLGPDSLRLDPSMPTKTL
ncbi:hypothetical protein LXL04_030903 [Taraxacum kok-saghyz]